MLDIDNKNPFNPGAVVDELRKLKNASDPAGGDITARGKHDRAVRAMHLAWKLFEQEAGWAIDHCAGLGAFGADDNIHKFDFEKMDKNRHKFQQWADEGGIVPEDASEIHRRCIITTLMAIPETPRSTMLHALMGDLAALEYGDAYGIVAPRVKPKRRGPGGYKFHIEEAILFAVKHFEFRRGAGTSAEDAEADILNAYGIDGRTFDNWKKRAQKKFGSNLKKHRRVARLAGEKYKNSGNLVTAKDDESFGDEAIKADGEYFLDNK